MSKHCQFNEEQHILEFFEKYGWGNRILCDIGARLEYSNTARLIEEYQFNGVLVDMNDKHCRVLKHHLPRANVITAKVGVDNINAIVPSPCDLLSIDIDSNDAWIFLNLLSRPRLVIIEALDFDELFMAPYSLSETKGSWGTSEKAITEFARMKGYRVAGKTGVNLFLVDESCDFSFESDCVRPALIPDRSLNVLRSK